MKPKGFQGWSFTPSQKVVDCGATECNAGQDVVFEVNGFSINGRILAKEADGCSHDQNQAFDSVTVQLHQEGNVNCG